MSEIFEVDLMMMSPKGEVWGLCRTYYPGIDKKGKPCQKNVMLYEFCADVHLKLSFHYVVSCHAVLMQHGKRLPARGWFEPQGVARLTLLRRVEESIVYAKLADLIGKERFSRFETVKFSPRFEQKS